MGVSSPAALVPIPASIPVPSVMQAGSTAPIPICRQEIWLFMAVLQDGISGAPRYGGEELPHPCWGAKDQLESAEVTHSLPGSVVSYCCRKCSC